MLLGATFNNGRNKDFRWNSCCILCKSCPLWLPCMPRFPGLGCRRDWYVRRRIRFTGLGYKSSAYFLHFVNSFCSRGENAFTERVGVLQGTLHRCVTACRLHGEQRNECRDQLCRCSCRDIHSSTLRHKQPAQSRRRSSSPWHRTRGVEEVLTWDENERRGSLYFQQLEFTIVAGQLCPNESWDCVWQNLKSPSRGVVRRG